MSGIFESSETQVLKSDIYDQFVINKLVNKNDPDYDTNPVTSHSVWKHYFKLKALAYREFDDAMKNCSKELDKIHTNYSKNTPPRYSIAKFETALSTFRANDENIVNVVDRDCTLFSDLRDCMNTYLDSDKDMLILKNSEKQLSQARKDFFDQAKEVEMSRDKYHKAAFKQEKTEIQAGLEEKQSEIRKLCDRFEHLRKKVDKTLDNYREEFEKLKERGSTLKEKSKGYTKAKVRVDVKRADDIMLLLDKYETKAKLHREELDTVDLKHINTTELVKHRLPKETIGIMKIEEYQVSKDREELIAKVKEEMAMQKLMNQLNIDQVSFSDSERTDDEDENNVQHISTSHENPNETPVVPFIPETEGDDIDNGEEEAAAPVAGPSTATDVGAGQDDEEIPGPSQAKTGQEYLITTSYRKQFPNQLNLRQGRKVKLILPPNEKGFAFGEKAGGIFGLKKKKGYFPWICVTPK